MNCSGEELHTELVLSMDGKNEKAKKSEENGGSGGKCCGKKEGTCFQGKKIMGDFPKTENKLWLSLAVVFGNIE